MKEEMSNSLAAFKAQLDDEVKKTLDEVGILRDQKKQLQSDLSDLLAFKSKVSSVSQKVGIHQLDPELMKVLSRIVRRWCS